MHSIKQNRTHRITNKRLSGHTSKRQSKRIEKKKSVTNGYLSWQTNNVKSKKGSNKSQKIYYQANANYNKHPGAYSNAAPVHAFSTGLN